MVRDVAAINDQVIDIIKRYLEDDSVEIVEESKLISDLGIDSLDLLDISFDLEQELNVSIPIDEWTANSEATADDFVEMLTLKRIVDFVATEQKS